MNFGAGAAANYLSAFGNGVPNPASLKAPEHLFSNAFTVGLGSIPQANLQAAVNTLSPIAQIGARAKADRDFLVLEDRLTRRRDRRRMAGQLLGSAGFGAGASGGVASTALASLQQIDPRTDYLAQLNYEQALRAQLGNATTRSGATTATALPQLRGAA